MNTNDAIKKLFAITAQHQEILTKLAQVAPQGDDLSAKLQEAFFAKLPQARSVMIEGPTVGTSAEAGGKMLVSFKFHSGGGKNGPVLRKAVEEVANSIIGPGKFVINAIGEW